MRVVVLGTTATTKPEEREVVGIDLKAVLLPKNLEEGCELGVRYLRGVAASFTHEVFVVVVECDMPPSRLTVSQRNVVHLADTCQIIKYAVDGRSLYPPGVLQNVVDDHAGAQEGLIDLGQCADHRCPGKGQAQSGRPDSLDHQIFGDDYAVGHSLNKL